MKALIIVDMQKGFMNNSNKHLIGKIEKLLADKKFDRIYATKFVNYSSSHFEKNLNWGKMKRSGMSEFSITLPENVKVIEKDCYALKDRFFVGSKFKFGDDDLDAEEDEIFICGSDYDCCVLAIGFQFFDHGFKTFFISDCIGTHTDYSIKKTDIEKICKKNFGEDCIIYAKG